MVVDGVLAERSMLDPWAEVDAEAALVAIPSVSLAEVLPLLDAATALIDRYR